MPDIKPALPNVLLIHSDQHRYDCLGVNGHPLLKTPVLDRLAAEGMNFTHAFTPIPLCVPERNSLLHGVWPTTHLSIANFDTEAPRSARVDLPAFTEILRQANYFLAYVGKWHVSQQLQPADYCFREYAGEGAYWKWRQERGLPPRPASKWFFGETDSGVRPEESRLAWSATQAIKFLERAATSRKPFLLRWDPPEPHLPNVVPEPYASMYPPESIPPWPGFADRLEGKPYIQSQQRRTWKLEGWTWSDWAPIVGRYLGEISLMDAQIGRVLEVLARLGLSRNTLVVYTTDHGDMCGSHGMIDKHFIMYDDVVRVPLIARWPRRIRAGSVCHAFVCHALDLAATFVAAADAPVPAEFQGQSLLPLFDGAADNGRSDIFSMYHGNQFGLYSQRMVRDRRWKYVWNATAQDELYDLQTDPGEITNLAPQPSARDELRRLRGRTVAWMEATRDRLLNQWTRAQLLEDLKV